MEYSEKDKALTYERDSVREPISTECLLEHTLPDYMPEIRKLLTVNARPVPALQYSEEGGTEFSGAIVYTVLYSDADGRLAAASVNGEYRFSCPYGGNLRPYAECEVEGTVCRLHGPRRMSLRSTVKGRVHTVETIPLDSPEGEGYERLLRRVPTHVTHLAESGEMPFSDAVTVPGISPEHLQLLYCDGTVGCPELRPGEGTVGLRATAHVRLVAVSEDGQPMSLSLSVPLEREIPCEGARPEDRALFDGCTTLLTVRSTGDGDGGTRFELDGVAEGRLRLYRSCEITPTVALYSKAFRTELKRETVETEALLGTAAGNYTVSGSGSAGPEEAGGTVLDSFATATVRKVTEEGGRPVVLGEVRIKHLVTLSPTEGGAAAPAISEYAYPFRIEAPISLTPGGERRYECTVRPVTVRGRTADGGYAADTELALSLAVFGRSCTEAVVGVTPHPEETFPKREGSITVVYPDEGDTLWSLAERYHTTPAALAESCGLLGLSEEAVAEPSSLDGVAYLLVE